MDLWGDDAAFCQITLTSCFVIGLVIVNSVFALLLFNLLFFAKASDFCSLTSFVLFCGVHKQMRLNCYLLILKTYIFTVCTLTSSVFVLTV